MGWIADQVYLYVFIAKLKCTFYALGKDGPMQESSFWKCLCLHFSIQNILKHQNVKVNLGAAGGAADIEDKLDLLMDANDQILERVVS